MSHLASTSITHHLCHFSPTQNYPETGLDDINGNVPEADYRHMVRRRFRSYGLWANFVPKKSPAFHAGASDCSATS
jgi:hypothetical protein